jgi:HEAT repeat protein
MILVVLVFSVHCFGIGRAADAPPVKEPSVGELIDRLGYKNPAIVCAAAKALGQIKESKEAAPALKSLLKHRNSRVRWTAAEALWRREHKATELLPVYAELLTADEPELRAASAWRLGRFGPEARSVVPLLAAALRDENFEVRIQVGQALANLGPWAEPALPALVRALGDPILDEPGQSKEDWASVRTSPALPALVELADAAIPLLIEKFREGAAKHDEGSSEWPRGWAIAGRAAHAMPVFRWRAVPQLLQSIDSKDEKVPVYAAIALSEVAQLHGLPPNAVEKLEECLESPDAGVRTNAARAVYWIRPSNAKAVTIILKSDEDRAGGRKELLSDLARFSPHNEEARKRLFGLLTDKDAETVAEAHRILAGLHLPADQVLEVWIKALAHNDPNVRSVAVEALERIGPGAKPAKAALLERFKKEEDGWLRRHILDVLAAIEPDGPALISFLIDSIEDRDSPVRREAIRCLAALGPKAKEAIPRIEAYLSNPAAKVKEGERDSLDGYLLLDLLTATARIAPGSTNTAATLIKALRQRDIRSLIGAKNSWYMRDELEDHLFASLPAAAPLLREALKDQDLEVRQSAALVLLRAGLDVDTALPVLMDKLWTGDDAAREQSRFQSRVVDFLSHRQATVSPAVAAACCKTWETVDPKVRGDLERLLIRLQSDSLPHLLDQLREAKNTQTRRDLAHLLARFEGQSERVVPILREQLREKEPADQYAAMQALTRLGPDGAEATPELVQLLSNAHPGMKVVAAQTLGGMGRAARPAAPALKAMLNADNPALRISAATALSRIDPGVSEALLLLRAELPQQESGRALTTDDIKLPKGLPDQGVYLDSIEPSIARFGEQGVLILADILDNVDLDEWSSDNVCTQCGSVERIQVARLLARLGPEAKPAVPALIRALKDKDPFIREAAASALGRIGPDAKKAAPDMISLLEEKNRLVLAGGGWSSSPATSDRYRSGGSDYGGLFDFRSAGRGKVLHPVSEMFGYGYGPPRDPYAHVRPDHPYDPVFVLSRIDGETRSSQPILREMARDASHPGRLSAALALWRMGCESPDLLLAFQDALKMNAGDGNNKRVALSRELHECLADLDTQLKPAIREMVEWLKQQSESADLEDQIAVMKALGRLGTDARAGVDVIRPFLDGAHWSDKRRVAAALTLFQMGEEKDRAFSVLREVLLGLEKEFSFYYSVDWSATARVRAAQALGVLAEKGDVRAKALITEAAKGDENSHVRTAAREALARLKK